MRDLKDYEKVKRSILRFKGDDRKEFLSAFLAGVLTDTTKLQGSLIRRKLGVTLYKDFGKAYGLLSWWFLSERLRNKMLDATLLAIDAPGYRDVIISLAKDGGKSRVLNALKYIDSERPGNKNVEYLISRIEEIVCEKAEYTPKISGKKNIRFVFVVDSLDVLAEALAKPFLKHLPKRDFGEVPQEIVVKGKEFEIRADILAANLQFAVEEDVKRLVEGAKFVIFVTGEEGKAVEFLQENAGLLKGAESLGIVYPGNRPPDISEDTIETLAGIPIFCGERAGDVMYNIALVAVEGW